MCFDEKTNENQAPTELLKSGKSLLEIMEITGMKKAALIKKLKKELLGIIKENLIKGLSVKKISTLVGLGHTTVRDWIKDNDLSEYIKNNNVNGLRSSIGREKFLREFVQGAGIVMLTKKFHIHRLTGKNFLEQYGFKIFNGNTVKKLHEALRGESFVQLTRYTRDVITGSLLGDGFITPVFKDGQFAHIASFKEFIGGLLFIKNMEKIPPNPNWNLIAKFYNKALQAVENHPTAIFGINKSVVETPWLQEVKNIMNANDFNSYFTKGYNKEFDKHSLLLRHKSTHQMFEEWKKWYKSGKKVIPDDLTLSPIVVRHWFAGDGRLMKDNCLIFCSESFSKTENQMLVNKLNKEISIEAIVSLNRKPEYPDREYWRIGIFKQNDVQKVFDYMEQGDAKAFQVLKETMPWKFDPDLRKKDELTDKVYSERIKEATKLAQEKT